MAPILLSFCVITLFFTGLSGFFLNQAGVISFNQIGASQNIEELQKREKQLTELNLPLDGKNIFDPTGVKVDQLFMEDQLILQSIKAIRVKGDPKDYVEATFNGEVEVVGTITRHKQEINGIEDPYVLIPTIESGKLLPKSHHDTRRRPLFFLENQDKIEEILHSYGYKGGNIAVVLHSLKINYLSQESVDTAVLKSKEVPIIRSFEYGMDKKLMMLYQELVKTKDENLLKGLQPKDIFNLYYHAQDNNEFETQYLLYNQDPNVGNKLSLKEFITNANQSKKSSFIIIDELKQNQTIKEVIVDSAAYIEIGSKEGLDFGLTKDQHGIWRVNWLTYQ
jgi:hypothetical protein